MEAADGEVLKSAGTKGTIGVEASAHGARKRSADMLNMQKCLSKPMREGSWENRRKEKGQRNHIDALNSKKKCESRTRA